MKSNIVVNTKLLDEAMQLSKAQSQTETVDRALQYFVAQLRRKGIKDLFGKVKWEGDLKKMREI